MPRQSRFSALPAELSPEIGAAANAMRFTVNISQDVGDQLKEIAFENRVSESSVIEVALRQLFRRVTPAALGAFLRQNGACLRRRS
ncbi:MAG TPA: hypothetical protein VFE36_13725 [Candidatus Baltobacteraceae bacterium]|jgi:hypothetical protein|nr:hypothetical protein [Candidatus Baltobacteraceae bacterium]